MPLAYWFQRIISSAGTYAGQAVQGGALRCLRHSRTCCRVLAVRSFRTAFQQLIERHCSAVQVVPQFFIFPAQTFISVTQLLVCQFALSFTHCFLLSAPPLPPRWCLHNIQIHNTSNFYTVRSVHPYPQEPSRGTKYHCYHCKNTLVLNLPL